MKLLYFDCHSGIAGDMILGALIDLGVDLKEIQKGLKSLGLKGYETRARKIRRGGFGACKFDVKVKSKSHHHRHLADITAIIKKSKLPNSVKATAVEVFTRLGKAEARVHRTTLAKIHFHEVGAVDSIVDIVGGVFALDILGVDKIIASPVNTGEGTVQCEHGNLPVPAPATLELLKNIPVFSDGVQRELTTPTGAAMIGQFAQSFGSMPLMEVSAIGYGAGSHVIENHPNLLRLVLGEGADSGTDPVLLMETNIDDMNPEIFDYVMERLFGAGALDVYITPISMKKNRPAAKLSVLCAPQLEREMARILFQETSTYGIRYCEMDRLVLDRESLRVKTPHGMADVKVGRWEGEAMQVSPEYDSCRKLAKKSGRPLKEIYEVVEMLARERLDR